MKVIKLFFSFFFSFVLLNACAIFLAACSAQCDLNSINNGTATPTNYNIGMSGTAIAQAVKNQLGNAASNRCDPPQDSKVRIKILVRTAKSENGQIVIEPKAYSEIDDDFDFQSKDVKTKINVKVPSTGSFGITIEIELPDCSNCCNAIASGLESDQQCYKLSDSNSRTFSGGNYTCKTGKPKLAIEKIYLSDMRPDTRYALDDLNIIYRIEDMMLRSCRNCSTCTNNCN